MFRALQVIRLLDDLCIWIWISVYNKLCELFNKGWDVRSMFGEIEARFILGRESYFGTNLIGCQMFSCLHVSGVPLLGWVVGSTKQEDGQGKQRGVRAKYSCNQRLTRAYLRLHLSVIQLIRACPDLGRSHLKIPSPLPPALTVPPSREKTF